MAVSACTPFAVRLTGAQQLGQSLPSESVLCPCTPARAGPCTREQPANHANNCCPTRPARAVAGHAMAVEHGFATTPVPCARAVTHSPIAAGPTAPARGPSWRPARGHCHASKAMGDGHECTPWIPARYQNIQITPQQLMRCAELRLQGLGCLYELGCLAHREAGQLAFRLPAKNSGRAQCF